MVFSHSSSWLSGPSFRRAIIRNLSNPSTGFSSFILYSRYLIVDDITLEAI